MAASKLSAFEMGDIYVQYQHDAETHQTGLLLVPAALRGEIVPRRRTLDGAVDPDLLRAHPGAAQGSGVDSLLQIKVAGDAPGRALSQGLTLRNSATTLGLRYEGQQVTREHGVRRVITRLSTWHGLLCEHRLLWHTDQEAICVSCTVTNGARQPVDLELFSSFSLGGITPFAVDDAPGRLRVHRFPSAWGAEGRPESFQIENLRLRRGWAVGCERFGGRGTMPAREFFPLLAIEDSNFDAFWGAQLFCASSWQMEIYREDDSIAISGGLADREFGHWMKRLEPGETFEAPWAAVAVSQGGLDRLCERFVRLQERTHTDAPESEIDLPICLNEWAASWGNPDHRGVCALAERAAGSGVGTLVIDAGWHAARNDPWERGLGDWIPSGPRFPQGMAATARAIRQAGLVPGIAFELESCSDGANAYAFAGHFLTRDGVPIEAGGRRLWDLQDPAVVAHLTERVLDLVEECGFGHVKIDCRESPGIGVDGAESPGEGLRRHVAALHGFLARLRERMPQVVIECAAPGGFRLDPQTLRHADLGSFSEARESLALPMVAANLQRIVPPRQVLLWTILHAGDSDDRLLYTLATAFLGRMCLSGEITRLAPRQWAIVKDAISLYRCVAPILRSGRSRRYGPDTGNHRQPGGWQAILRMGTDEALLVCHAFAGAAPSQIHVPIAQGGVWEIADLLNPRFPLRSDRDAGLTLCPPSEYTAQVALLRRVGA